MLIFAILFAVFTISPAFLDQPFGLYPFLRIGDVVDFFTPLVIIPLYWVLVQTKRDRVLGQRETLVFLILAALWVEGQSVHLAANAIGHLTKEMPDGNATTLVHFLDEVLSHYLWHVGMFGLSALLICDQWRNAGANECPGLGFDVAAGIIHGFNYFLLIVEGGTTAVGVPFALLVVIAMLVWGRRKLYQQHVLRFFFAAYLLATLCFLAWGMYWSGLPEFSQVGIID